VAKPELGTKRICAGCNLRFYDLHQTPIVCPTCAAVFVLPKPAPVRPMRKVEPRPTSMTMTAIPQEPDVAAVLDKDDADEDAVAAVAVQAEEGEESDDDASDVPMLEEIDED
jgi:uncharacterized protein (TIGR02300 family)